MIVAVHGVMFVAVHVRQRRLLVERRFRQRLPRERVRARAGRDVDGAVRSCDGDGEARIFEDGDGIFE